MKHSVVFGVLFAGVVASAQADEWKMMPFKEDGWSPDFTLAVAAGHMATDIDGVDDDAAYGIQLSLNCPWFSPPFGNIRQQFNYNVFDNDGVKVSTIELNPRWYEVDGNLSYGIGPGIGYVQVEPDNGNDHDEWAVQLGADIEYRQGSMFYGFGSRYQRVNDSAADNLLTQFKVGVNF